MTNRDRGKLVLHRLREDRARGIARVAEEQRLRARRDRRLDGDRIEREVVLVAGRDMPHDAAREDDGRHVGDVRRLVEDDLVTRVAGGAQREVDRLRGADRDQQLGRRVVVDAVQALQVAGQRLAELERPVVARVVGAPFAEALDARLHDRPGRVEIGLPHPEADDVVHRGEDVEEAADPRWRHDPDAFRQRTLGKGRTVG